jgi:hypothetical protein
MLSSYYRDIQLFRFDQQIGNGYILAANEMQVIVPLAWRLVFPMSQNFEQMSKSELTAYVLENRNDLEAMRYLFRLPPGVEVKRYPPMFTQDGKPIEENIRIAEEAIRQKIEEIDKKKQNKQDQEN